MCRNSEANHAKICTYWRQIHVQTLRKVSAEHIWFHHTVWWLSEWIEQMGCQGQCHWLGSHSDPTFNHSNGYTFKDRLSFEACNEGDYEEFTAAVELYKKRFGCYPERILADKIGRSRKNRKYYTEHGIGMSGPKLGKPKADNSAEIAIKLKEIYERN